MMLITRARSLSLIKRISSAFKVRNLGGLKWESSSALLQGETVVKPLSAMPTPRGALPFLGHHLLLKQHKHKISQLYCDLSKQLGPIFKIKLPAGMSLQSTYRSASNNCGYKTLRSLQILMIFSKMRFFKMRDRSHYHLSD